MIGNMKTANGETGIYWYRLGTWSDFNVVYVFGGILICEF